MPTTSDTVEGQRPSPDPAQRKREQRGWYMYDWANTVFLTSVVTVLIGPYLSDLARHAAAAAAAAPRRVSSLAIAPLGADFLTLHPNALYPALTTLAILIQIVLLPVVGALADHTKHKKSWLLWMAVAGSACTTGLYFATDGYLLASVL